MILCYQIELHEINIIFKAPMNNNLKYVIVRSYPSL